MKKLFLWTFVLALLCTWAVVGADQTPNVTTLSDQATSGDREMTEAEMEKAEREILARQASKASLSNQAPEEQVVPKLEKKEIIAEPLRSSGLEATQILDAPVQQAVQEQIDHVLLGNADPFPPAEKPEYTGPKNIPDQNVILQGGDVCASATNIPGIPFYADGFTTGYTDDYDEVCDYAGSLSPDVVYSYTPAADILVDITLCVGQTDYDTKLYIYEDDCASAVYACNDDACVAPSGQDYVSQLDCILLAEGHTYYIVVDGYGSEFGNYSIDISECVPPTGACCDGADCIGTMTQGECDNAGGVWYEGEDCATFTCPEACIVECPPDSYIEQEDCGLDVNGGCNMPPGTEYFEPIQLGWDVCGTGWADGGSRDTDWFELDLAEATSLTVTAEAEFPLQLLVIYDANCAAPGFSYALLDPCVVGQVTVDAGPGLAWVWIGDQAYEGNPCGGGNDDYWFTTGTVILTGACCDGADCLGTMTQDECDNLGGDWYAGMDCATFVCPVGATCSDASVWDNGVADGVNGARPTVNWDPNGMIDDVQLETQTDFTCIRVEVAEGTTPLGVPSDIMSTRIRIYDAPNGMGSLDWPTDGGNPLSDITYQKSDGSMMEIDSGADLFGRDHVYFDLCGPNISLPAGNYGVFLTFPGRGPDDFFWLSATNAHANETNYIWGPDVNPPSPNSFFPETAFHLGIGTCEDVYGACCDDATGVCTDDVLSSDCPPPLRFAANTLCVDLEPPCGEVTGACCFDDGSCLVLGPADCEGQGGVYQGDLTDCDPNPCPQPPPPNDLCQDAILIDVPSFTEGYTTDGTIDAVPTCGTTITAPGVWYKVIGTGNTITATTCTDLYDYDTKISVYCVSCEAPFCVDGNDDDCVGGPSGLLSTVTWCSEAGSEYWILVHGFSSNTGIFHLDVSDDGVPCDNPPLCAPCVVECPPEAIPEGEPVCEDESVDNYNGGCNSTPSIFQDINLGDIICGESGTFLFTGLDYRDTDWFRVTTTEYGELSWSVLAEFPGLIFIMDAGSGDCEDYTILGSLIGDECVPLNLTFEVPAGTYWLWVGPSIFTGIPCGAQYVGEVEFLPLEPTYCDICYTDCADTPDDWITNVTFNTINNTTAWEGCPCSYGDYTAMSTDVGRNETHNLSVSFESGNYTEHVWAWIDWNQNLVFEGSEGYDLGDGASTTLNIDITVPGDALLGSTRMRVVERWNSDPTPCDQYSYGETEDYTVVVTTGVPLEGACCIDDICEFTSEEQECLDAGGTWYASETCPDFTCPEPPEETCADASIWDNGVADLVNGVRPTLNWDPNGIVEDFSLDQSEDISCFRVELIEGTTPLDEPSDIIDMRIRIYDAPNGTHSLDWPTDGGNPLFDYTYSKTVGELDETDSGNDAFGFDVVWMDGCSEQALITLGAGNYGMFVTFPGRGPDPIYWATTVNAHGNLGSAIWGPDIPTPSPTGVGELAFHIGVGTCIVGEPDCVYNVGDADCSGTALELSDVIAMISQYRGTVPVCYTCDCPPNGDAFAPHADPNSNCVALELSDVVMMIALYRGNQDPGAGCQDCPALGGRLAPGGTTVVPSLKSKVKTTRSAD